LTRLRVYHFWCYWPSYLLSLYCHMCDLCSKFEEDQKKLRSLLWTNSIVDGHTQRHRLHSSDFYPSNAMHCIAQTIKRWSIQTWQFIL